MEFFFSDQNGYGGGNLEKITRKKGPHQVHKDPGTGNIQRAWTSKERTRLNKTKLKSTSICTR